MAAPASVQAHRLEPKFVERIWGTKRLQPFFADKEKQIGEVWFTPRTDYPLLFKFLFTAERLSVQVHPGDDFARCHESSRGKTEMWHVLAAEPGASVAIGFRETVSPERLRAAVADGSVEALLRWIPVKPGDSYLLPAGVVHALGAGLTVCEIQQNSDVTYRLYDYGRGRELHIDKALKVIDLEQYDPVRELPVDCGYFRSEIVEFTPEKNRLNVAGECTMLAIAGSGFINGRPFSLGQAWFLPDGGVIESKNSRLVRVCCGAESC